MNFCRYNTLFSLSSKHDKPDAILRQSDKPPKLISKLYQGLIEAFPDDPKHENKNVRKTWEMLLMIMNGYRCV
jgi:hypothetical protein